MAVSRGYDQQQLQWMHGCDAEHLADDKYRYTFPHKEINQRLTAVNQCLTDISKFWPIFKQSK